MNALHLLLYLGVGIGSDLLVTGYYICVARGWAWAAASVSIPIALLNFYVLGGVLVNEQSVTRKWYLAIAYAIGNAIGCYIIITLLGNYAGK